MIKIDKRELILKAMQELLLEDKGASCSVSDIAKRAGIGKGSIYYYYKSKDEIFDDVVEQTYNQVVSNCKTILDNVQLNAVGKLTLLFKSYRDSTVAPSIDSYLHQNHNAAIHQKSLAKILNSLSPIIADIIHQGVNEKVFVCENPQETAEIILSVLCFLFDPGIFQWTPEQLYKKSKTLAGLLESGLSAPEGSFQFFYQ